MAYATENTTRAQGALASRIDGLMIDLRARLARRRTYLRTVAELQALSDRELADLGLHRSEIGRVARQAAYDM